MKWVAQRGLFGTVVDTPSEHLKKREEDGGEPITRDFLSQQETLTLPIQGSQSNLPNFMAFRLMLSCIPRWMNSSPSRAKGR